MKINIYKTIIISVIVIILGLGIYWFWTFISKSPETAKGPKPAPTSTVPKQKEGGQKKSKKKVEGITVKKVSDNKSKVFDFWTNKAGRIFYIRSDGKIFSANKKEEDKKISNNSLNALNSIEKSPKNKNILVAHGNPNNPSWMIFDTKDKVWRPLPEKIEKVTWSEKGDYLIGIIKNGKNLTLGKINLKSLTIKGRDVSYEKIVSDFRMRDTRIEMVTSTELIVKERSASFYDSRVWKINMNTKKLELSLKGVSGLVQKWSEDNNIVFQYSNQEGFQVLNRDFQNIIPVFFNSLPSKCVNSEKLIFCGAPQNINPGDKFSLPEDYYKRKFFTNDGIYKINKKTSKIKKVIGGGNDSRFRKLDIKNPLYRKGNLYFINRYDKGLYKITLPSLNQ
ncbi:MAG: hypothetical protein ABEI53_03195 [Candidatus Magasanikbacteria bacterium]